MNKKILVAVISLVIFCFILVGCSEPITAGTVTMKEHYGGNYVTTMVNGTPITRLTPRTYYIWISDSKDVRLVQVSKTTYDSIEIGDYWEIPEKNQ